jgi:hypothetical protein
MLIQLASLVAVHVHSRAAATEIFTWPPPAATVGADAGNSVAQRTVLGPVISVTEVPPHATERESAVTKSPSRQVSRRCTAGADASQVPVVRPSGAARPGGGRAQPCHFVRMESRPVLLGLLPFASMCALAVGAQRPGGPAPVDLEKDPFTGITTSGTVQPGLFAVRPAPLPRTISSGAGGTTCTAPRAPASRSRR